MLHPVGSLSVKSIERKRRIHSGARKNLSQLPSSAARYCEWATPFIRIPHNEEYYVAKIGNQGKIKFEFNDKYQAPFFTIEDD